MSRRIPGRDGAVGADDRVEGRQAKGRLLRVHAAVMRLLKYIFIGAAVAVALAIGNTLFHAGA